MILKQRERLGHRRCHTDNGKSVRFELDREVEADQWIVLDDQDAGPLMSRHCCRRV